MRMKRARGLTLALLVFFFALVATTLDMYAQQSLNENCVVSILNRNAQVRPDGSWDLPNVPAGFGPVRARATCVENGITRSGESNFFTITAGRMNAIPPIVLGPTTPIPQTLSVTTGTVSLTQTGQTTQLTVIATYAGGTTQNVTAAGTGTTYLTTNPAIASVAANGLVSAVTSGTVLIRASNEGTAGLITIQVVLTGDKDGDGIADDIELTQGLNPNDPTDALLDPDVDGLSNRSEVTLGTNLRNADTDGDTIKDGEEVVAGADGFITNPLLADTDGDGVRDPLEIASGSDPTNPNSINLANALSGITVVPTSFVLTVNSIVGQASQQLTVTGQLKDSTTINLTSTLRGTNYASSDLNVCNFGSPDGRVFAANNGSCTIAITNSGFSTQSLGTVNSFTPTPLSFVPIPGFANNVDVSGNFAYVAAGATGLQIVNVANRTAPVVVASLATPGNANDVVIVGNRAYVADGSAGLRIIDVTNPLAPVSIGAFDTPGDAVDVVVSNNRAYVADGISGLRIIDVSNPANPQLLGSVDPPGTQKGVDVDAVRNIAVVASGTSGLHVINVSNPANPSLVGSLAGGDVRDVVLKNDFAFLADNSRSFTSVDLANPSTPILRSSTPQNLGGLLQDVAVSGNFALGADVVFVNGVPILDVSTLANPIPRSILSFSNFRDDDGQGIAVDGSFVYLAAVLGSAFTENGTTGNSRLYIGQYLAQQDKGGVPPAVLISSPASGSTFVEGMTIPVNVNATDDVAVASVTLLVNGQATSTDTSFPYQFTITAPQGASSQTLGATAVDLGGNIGTAPNVSINIIPDPRTQVTGTVVDQNNNAIVGATVTCLTQTGLSSAGGAFSISGVATVQGNISCRASYVDSNAKTLTGVSAAVAPVSGGLTNVGQILLGSGNILFLADAISPGTTALVDALTAAGNTVTLRPPPEYTWDGTNPPLAGFDVVILLDGATPYNGFSPTAQTAMVNFVSAGGGFISSGWLGYEVVFGISPLMRDIALQGAGSGLGGGAATYTQLVSHPILQGLPNQFTLQTDGDEAGPIFTYPSNPVLKIMNSSTGPEAGIYVRDFSLGRAVKFSFMAHWSGQSGNVLTDPNAQTLFINAVRWAAHR